MASEHALSSVNVFVLRGLSAGSVVVVSRSSIRRSRLLIIVASRSVVVGRCGSPAASGAISCGESIVTRSVGVVRWVCITDESVLNACIAGGRASGAVRTSSVRARHSACVSTVIIVD